jgi:DNA polymerase III psi subunit
MVVVPLCAGETVVVVKDRLMDLPVNPNFTQFRSREPADSRVEKFVKAYTKANCEVRVNMVLEEAITWPKMLVKAFEKMHQMRKVGFKKAASLKRQSKPRNPERRTRQQHRVPAGSAAGPSGSSAAAAAAASPDVIDAAAAAAKREALWQQALAEEGNAGVMSDSEGMEEDLFGLPSP